MTEDEVYKESVELYGHLPIRINKNGEGPITGDDKDDSDSFVCWTCSYDWPCPDYYGEPLDVDRI